MYVHITWIWPKTIGNCSHIHTGLNEKNPGFPRKKSPGFYSLPFFGKPRVFSVQKKTEDFQPPSFPDFRRKTTSASAPAHRLRGAMGNMGNVAHMFFFNIKITPLAILLVTFSGWISDPSKWLSDLQIGDKSSLWITWPWKINDWNPKMEVWKMRFLSIWWISGSMLIFNGVP